MKFKNLVVRMMAVLVLAGVVLSGATPSKAAEATETTETITKQENNTVPETNTQPETSAKPEVTAQPEASAQPESTVQPADSSQTVTKKPSQQAVSKKKVKKKKKYTKKELKMMSAIIFCEAGMQAVGIVVMNRKSSSKFPNSIQKVLKQSYQFTPVRTGKWSKEMKKYSKGKYKKGARAKCVKAAKAALEGQKTVTYKGKKINLKKYHFFSQHLKKAKLRIGGHDFR